MDARIAASPGMNAGMLVSMKASGCPEGLQCEAGVCGLTYANWSYQICGGMLTVQMALVVKAQMKSVVPPDVIVILKPVSADAARRIVAQTSGCVSRAQMGIVEKNRTHVPSFVVIGDSCA